MSFQIFQDIQPADTPEPQISNLHDNRKPTRGRLAPLEPLEHSPTDQENKKKKKKKKKRKANKTAPTDDDMEMGSRRSVTAWGGDDNGSTSNMNGYAGSKPAVSPRRLEPLEHQHVTGLLRNFLFHLFIRSFVYFFVFCFVFRGRMASFMIRWPNFSV